MKSFHHGKSKLKVEFDIHIQEVTGLTLLENSALFVCWKRGSRKKSGMTRRSVVKSGVAHFDEHVVFSGTLFQNSKGQADAKTLMLYIREASAHAGENSKLLFKRAVDVAGLAQPVESQTPLQPATLRMDSASSTTKGIKPCIVAVFGYRPTSFNDHVLHRVKTGEPLMGPIKVIDGKQYALGEHIDDPEESAADTVTSDDWDEEPLDDDAPVLKDGSSDLAAELLAAKREIERLQADNREYLITITELQKNVRELRHRATSDASGIPPMCPPDISVTNLTTTSTTTTTTPSTTDVPVLTRGREPSVSGSSPAEAGVGGDARSVGSGDTARSGPTLTGVARNASAFFNRKNSNAAGMLSDTVRDAYDKLVFIDQTLYRGPIKLNNGVPVAATALLDELDRWKTFQNGDEDQVRNINKILTSICENCTGNIDRTAYWVSTLCSLLSLLRKKKFEMEAGATPEKITRMENTRGVFDACLTNLLFVQYKSIVTVMLNSIQPYLGNTFFTSPAQRGQPYPMSNDGANVVVYTVKQNIDALEKYNVPKGYSSQILQQLSYQISALLVNHLLRHADCCTAENGMHIVLQIKPVTELLKRRGMSEAVEQFDILRDVSRLLSTNKSFIADPGVLSTLCPKLSFTLARLIASSCSDTPREVADKLKALDNGNGGSSEEIDVTFVHKLSYDFIDE